MKSSIKYYIMACLACCGAMTTGCTDDVMEEVSDQSSAVVNDFKIEASLAGENTRLELGQDGLKTLWEPGDKLALVKKDRTIAPIYLNTEISQKVNRATFLAEVGVPTGDYYVMYNNNDELGYGLHYFQSIGEINNKNSLVLWDEITIDKGTSIAKVQLKHLYSKVRVALKNVPYGDYHIGVYSTKKGFPEYMMFTNEGLVPAEYGYDPNRLDYGDNNTYFPSDKRNHNMRLGNNYYNGYNPDNAEVEKESALIFPADLRGEDVYFYAYKEEQGQLTCFEFKRNNIQFKAGVSYKLELDANQATRIILNKEYTNGDSYTCLLTTAEDCRVAAYRVGNYKLVNDIDFKDKPFLPFAMTDKWGMAYGALDGMNHKISNISLDFPNEDCVGFTWYGGSIKNLTLENVNIKGRNYVGAFGGKNVTIENCKLLGTSTIEGNDYIGGIVGRNELESRSVVNAVVGQSCTVTGRNYVGGVVGQYFNDNHYGSSLSFSSSKILMEKCHSSATVTATGDYVGGLFGKIGGGWRETTTSISFSMSDYTFSLAKCVNDGNVSGKNFVGGLGGELAVYSYGGKESKVDNVVLKQSYSEGTVNGESVVGGLLGYGYPSINTCYSRGTVKAKTTEAGGIVGHYNSRGSRTSRIANCYSLAEVSAGTNAGGIVGYVQLNTNYGKSRESEPAPTTIINCYFAGTNATNCGIVGFSQGLCGVTNCLTTLSSLGTNLGQHGSGGYYQPYYNDVITNSFVNVQSILEKKSVINSENAYSDACWPSSINTHQCVKFDEFILDGTDSPDFNEDVMK